MDKKTTYQEMTDYVLNTVFPRAVGEPYQHVGVVLTTEQAEARYAKFRANFQCACGAGGAEWYSPEGLIDHWSENPDCYKRTRK